jgi:hypothetical protein
VFFYDNKNSSNKTSFFSAKHIPIIYELVQMKATVLTYCNIYTQEFPLKGLSGKYTDG